MTAGPATRWSRLEGPSLAGLRLARGWLLVPVVVVVTLAFAFGPALSRVPWSDYYQRRADVLTELSFREPAALPKTFVPGQKFELGFTVVNRSASRRELALETVVTDLDTGAATTTSLPAVTLDPRTAVDRQAPVTIGDARAVRVSVQVGDGPEIAVLLTREGAGP